MQTSCKLFVAWCCRNKRGKSVILILFLLALSFLLWQIRRMEDMRINARLAEIQDQSERFPRIINIQPNNHTYALRQRNVIKQCELTFGPSWSTDLVPLPEFKDSPIISRKHNLMYCPVGKVASSFFTRSGAKMGRPVCYEAETKTTRLPKKTVIPVILVLAIDNPGPLTSPLDIPIEDAGRARCQNLKSLGSKSNMVAFLRQSTKVVFGRNPFSRIYSAYIDKLFSPNPFYWTYWGEKALKLNKATKGGKPCASDVTFPQFLHLVLFSLHKHDVHLRQVYDECHMCELVYDVIGTLETMAEDLDYILGHLNISSSFQHEPSYSLASKMDIVYDSVQSTFSWKADIARCTSLDQMGTRIWRKLQIRGVIDSSIRYPFRSGQIDNLHSSEFIKACKQAILMSNDHKKLEKQKRQALVEAYKTVSRHDLVVVGNVYKDDFRMFGYNPKPADIFEKQIKNTGSLNWRTDWIL